MEEISVDDYNEIFRKGQQSVIKDDKHKDYLWDFAGQAMQGLISATPFDEFYDEKEMCKLAINQAKELIKQLEAE